MIKTGFIQAATSLAMNEIVSRQIESQPWSEADWNRFRILADLAGRHRNVPVVMFETPTEITAEEADALGQHLP
jgi:hypothetical protein